MNVCDCALAWMRGKLNNGGVRPREAPYVSLSNISCVNVGNLGAC